MTNPFAPRKAARQARARDTVLGILQASAELVVRHGVERLTTNHIAERAGVSVGSLYQYFPSKEAIIQALIEHEISRAVDAIVACIEGTDPARTPFDEAVALLVDRVLDLQRKNSAIYQQLLKATLSLKHCDFVHRNDARVLAALDTKLREYGTEVDAAALDLGVRVALYTLKGVQMGVVFGCLRADDTATRDHLVRVLRSCVLGATKEFAVGGQEINLGPPQRVLHG